MRRCLNSLVFLVFLLERSSSKAIKDMIPKEAPDNLTLIGYDDRDVIIEWKPVSPESLRGTFRGYLARVWNHGLTQVYAIPPDVTRTSVQFFPFSQNFVTVAARNDRFVGPRSRAVSFDAPQTEPNMPFLFDYHQLGSNSVLLQWNRPTQPNGILLGYSIRCSEMRAIEIDEKTTVKYFVVGPENFQAKLTGLKDGVRYAVEIGAVNCAGEGERKILEIELKPHAPQPPTMPSFKYKLNFNQTTKDQLIEERCSEKYGRGRKPQNLVDDFYTLNEQKGREKEREATPVPDAAGARNASCLVSALVRWSPDVDGNPGEHFYVRHRQKWGEAGFSKSQLEKEEDYVVIEKFNACVNNELIVVAVDGEFETQSEVQETPAVVFATRR